jgi:tryptophanyl-tRNA synthetase
MRVWVGGEGADELSAPSPALPLPPTSGKNSGMTSKKKKRVLTGLKPTGDLHLGNYIGAIKPCIDFSNDPDHEAILMCADWHGLTDKTKIFEPGETSLPILAAFVALGYQLDGNSLILQSDFPQIQENAWYLSCAVAVGMLERAHAYKDALEAGKKPTGGLLYYPVLMASDILTFDAERVPVGKDQAQHLEYTSDMAHLFNNLVGKKVFNEVEGIIQDQALLIGTDGERKMSKSYNNYLPIFAPKKEIEKRIKDIKTDSRGLDDVKDPQTCVIFQLLKAFGSPEAVAHMKERLEKGKGYGYGHAKMDLTGEHEKVFGSRREAYEYYLKNPKELRSKMAPGYERASGYANAVRDRAREALKLIRWS